LAEGDEGARHLLTDSSKLKHMLYDPQFYEYTALCHIAKVYSEPLRINYRVPDFSLPISKRFEFDGYFEKENIAVEIKSYPLKTDDINEIDDKYKQFDISKLIIVTPQSEVKNTKSNIQLLEFKPDTDSVNASVYQNLPVLMPNLLKKELFTGNHNFRYRLAKRSVDRRSRYLNQTDKKINTVQKLKNEIIKRIPTNNPPIKVLWSTKRWISPKDHFFNKRNNLYLGGPIVFDIDGPKVHGAFKCCELTSKNNLCEMCIFFAKQEIIKLTNILDWAGFRNIEIFFSGRSGFHVYVFDPNDIQLGKASEKFIEKKIKIDKQVTYSAKSEVAFPLTINGFTGYQLKHVKRIEAFEPKYYG
jgi:hypothetical protein